MTTRQEVQAAWDALDAAAAVHLAHRRAHRCSPGSGCETGRQLAAAVTGAQRAWGIGRFMALGEQEGTTWTLQR